MKYSDIVYIIFRVYPAGSEIENYQYGWSKNKNLVKAFMRQRDHHKYTVRKVYEHELKNSFKDGQLEKGRELDVLEIRSNSTGEKVTLIMTAAELTEAELKLVSLFENAPKLNAPKGLSLEPQVLLFQMLNDEYTEALDYFGFWPIQMESLYDSVESPDSASYSPSEFDTPSIRNDSRDYIKCLESLEGLMMVLREEF